jgi:M6 family metalloprotease-like protein
MGRCRLLPSMGLVVVLLAAAVPAFGQVAVEATRTRDGLTLELPADGAWRVRAGTVARLRAELRDRGDFAGLNAALAAEGPTPAPAAVSGVMRVPALLFGFRDTDTTALSPGSRYDSLYFGLTPPTGRSYSLRTLYREMSNDLFDIQGQSLGWVLGDSAAAWYLGACGTDNAIDCAAGRSRLWALWSGALAALDPMIDFGQFDNDGPDGIPNSGDDDGFVDVLQLVQPVLGGECGGSGVRAHRWFFSGLSGTTFQTDDPAAGGGTIRINSYFISSGVGGAGPGNRSGCGAPGQISGIGTTAHEFGHAIALPDLYDTGGGTQGIGEWGLMGSGGYTSANSPAHLSAWSKERLGWATVLPLAAAGTHVLPPVVSADTVHLVRPPAGFANSRGEYFLLENKQASGSDTANVLTGGNAGPKQGGLLLWHIDSVKVAAPGNSVNSGLPHGVALEQADGLGQLQLTSGGNRGDAGDPYPGAFGRTVFNHLTNPAATLNVSNLSAGFAIDSIRQVTPGGDVAFRLRFGMPLLATASGPGAVIADPAVPGDTLLPLGTSVTLAAVADPDGVFLGWQRDTVSTNTSLALTMTRPWTVQALFGAVLAMGEVSPPPAVMGASYLLALPASGGTGSYAWTLQSGTLPAGLMLRPAGSILGVPEETGTFPIVVRVESGAQSLDRALTLDVTAPALTTSTVLGVLLGTGGTPLTSDERRYLDLLGNRNGQYDVGDFRAFIDKTGGAVTAAMMAELLRKEASR